MSEPMYGVYRKLHNGNLLYVSRSATTNKKLAEEIAAELTSGNITMPDGSNHKTIGHPHIAKEIGE